MEAGEDLVCIWEGKEAKREGGVHMCIERGKGKGGEKNEEEIMRKGAPMWEGARRIGFFSR